MTVFFVRLGSARIKAACKMLVKLTPDGGLRKRHFEERYNEIEILTENKPNIAFYRSLFGLFLQSSLTLFSSIFLSVVLFHSLFRFVYLALCIYFHSILCFY